MLRSLQKAQDEEGEIIGLHVSHALISSEMLMIWDIFEMLTNLIKSSTAEPH